MEQELKEKIDGIVSASQVLLFMKGDKSQPRCGFSARVVGILTDLDLDFSTVDILHPNNQDLRTGMKEYSSWPTFPQLYVKEEFIGGSDIVSKMYASGELQSVIGVEVEEVPMPVITLSSSIIEAFEAAVERYSGVVRIDIDSNFQLDIGVGQAEDNDYIVESNGFAVHLTRNAAKRADGLALDFDPELGIMVDNPNAPKSVKQIDVHSLQKLIASDERYTLLDVRTQQEMANGIIPTAVPLSPELLSSLDKNSIVVLYCHHGVRSQQAAQTVLQEGFSNVFNLAGGIHLWSTQIDNSIPTY